MDMLDAFFHLPLTHVLILMAVAFVAGVVDAIAGGGGMLNVPAMMLAGLPPVEAVATNKLQGTFGVASATRSYAAAGLIDFRAMRLPVLAAALGASAGAVAALVIPSLWLRTAVPFILFALAVFVLTSPKMSDNEVHARLDTRTYSASSAAPIGFYDGFFGPGGGTFFFISLVTLLGQGVTRAAGNAKLLNLASNAGAFALFAFSGAIWWKVGLALGAASFFGAKLGAKLAIRVGASLIRPLVVVVSVAMAIRLLVDPAHPVGLWLRSFF